MVADPKDSFKIGSKAIIVADCCILHPRCTIAAIAGPIVIGSNCIFEETVVIANRTKRTMHIGDNNLFQVGCRIEAASVGSHNTFGARCRVNTTVSISSYTTIGAGCVVLPTPFPPASFDLPETPASPSIVVQGEDDEVRGSSEMSLDAIPPAKREPPALEMVETLPDFTIVYGGENRRRKWTGEGQGQGRALHVKHLVYLSETLPKFHKLRMFS